MAATRWVTGAEFQQRLAQPVNVVWAGNPLRQALRGLSRAQQVAILIDRRVDPQQKLELGLGDVPLETALQQIAQNPDRPLGISLLGPVAYFGPPRSSSRLRTIVALRSEEIRRLPAATRRTFLQSGPLAWEDFATPRQLLAELGEQNGLAISGLERVPHDLWAAADLPPLPLVDRLTLIAVQFDLTFQVASNGRSLALVPLPEDVALVRSHPGGTNPQDTAQKYAALAPAARVKVVGDKVYVKGLLEDHLRIASPRRPPTPPAEQPSPAVAAIRVDKMTVREVPVGQLLEHLATRLKLELRIDQAALREAGISLERRVSVSVEDASVDELLRAVTRPARLSFRRQGRVVRIGPAG